MAVTDIATYVVIGSIVGVALILVLLGWRFVVEFRKGAKIEDENR
ncbi:MAG: hypothetical protein SXQ77_10340 [Halobacteria archaeon]|nr:hypothetical protein [Halobacteria archaeon]